MEPQTTPENANAVRGTCAYCKSPFTPRRRDQRCCGADCRQAWEKQKRQLAKQRPAHVCTCDWCDGKFETARIDRHFCGPACQQAFNNFWKGWGPRFGKALLAWRVKKRPGAFTQLCRLVSEARQAAKDKRKDTRE